MTPGSEKYLTELRATQYGGSWQRMKEDLMLRLTRRPYVPSIHRRIAADLVKVQAILEADALLSRRTDAP